MRYPKQALTVLFGVLFVGFLLSRFPLEPQRVAFLRWERQLAASPLRDILAQQCSTLKPLTGTLAERRFIEKTPLPYREPALPCSVRVAEASAQRLGLRSTWHFAVEVWNAEEKAIVPAQHFSVEFPLPLALWPLALFLVALLVQRRNTPLGILAGLHLLALSGGSIAFAFENFIRATTLTLQNDKPFVGLSLLALFLALYRSRPESVTRTASTPWEKWGSGMVSHLSGLWSPPFFTLLAPVLSPWSRRIARIRYFFDYQATLLCLSLYLLAFNRWNFTELFEKNLSLPRYFTYATFAFLLLSRFPSNQRTPRFVVWTLPRFFRHVGVVFVVELCALFIPALKGLPTLVRIGLSLLLSEATVRLPCNRLTFMEDSTRLLGAIFAASFFSSLSLDTGALDLTLALCEPRIHPSVLMLFTFLAGTGLGFVTGSISTSFFTLAPILTKIHSNPIIPAALVDGIAAGVLLSPFSILNLLPAAHYGVRIYQIVAVRFRQLAIPFGVGAVIYTVSAVEAVAILRPVTFLFLCLVIAAIQLKARGYRLGTLPEMPSSDTPENK
jgi:hypothetical protein